MQSNLEELLDIRCIWIGAYHRKVSPPGRWLGNHLTCMVLWFIESGYVDIRSKYFTKRVHAGHWVFMMPTLLLDQQFSADASIRSFRFYLKWSSGRNVVQSQRIGILAEADSAALMEASSDLLNLMPQRGFYLFKQLISEHIASIEEMWLYKKAEAEFLRQWYLSSLALGYAVVPNYTHDKRVELAINILNDQWQPNNVPYDLLTERLHISRAQLDRLFQKELGTSPKAEHNRIRIQIAQEQLMMLDRSVKQIAFDLGFKDASQFAKWFRRLDGRNPNEARKNE